MLILGELSCWTIFGVHKADPRLLTLGFTGVTASLLMLARIRRTSKNERLRTPGAQAEPGSPTTATVLDQYWLDEQAALAADFAHGEVPIAADGAGRHRAPAPARTEERA